jgi:hypothetical protein
VSNNVYVDIASINSAISTLHKLEAEAEHRKYWVKPVGTNGYWAAPLHMNASNHDFKMEAVALTHTDTRWVWTNNKSLEIKYDFVMDFAHPPVVSITFNGNKSYVTTRISLITDARGGNDYVRINIDLPPNTSTANAWKKGRDTFNVHLIAMGN